MGTNWVGSMSSGRKWVILVDQYIFEVFWGWLGGQRHSKFQKGRQGSPKSLFLKKSDLGKHVQPIPNHGCFEILTVCPNQEKIPTIWEFFSLHT